MSTTPATREVIAIDAGIADWETLVASLDPAMPIILLPAGGNGLEALALALADYGTLNALHLVTHGSEGQLHLGALRLNTTNLGEQAPALAQIASHLAPGADLLLYGCSVAQGESGQAFVNSLSGALNGADIAASTDRTGALALGGDWDLEYWAGQIETMLPFDAQDIVEYRAAFAGDDIFDTTPPTVSSINRVSTAITNATSVNFTVKFSESVSGVDTSDFSLNKSNTANGTISSVTGSGDTYTVTVNSISGDGTVRLDLKSSGTGIKDTSSNAISDGYTSGQLYTIDHTAPAVASVNSSAANGTYKEGDTVSLQVNFSETVTVTGTPQLTLETGTTDRAVNYTSGSGTSELTFTYTVQAGDTTADLDYLGITALALNGGTIKDAAGNASTLTLAAPGAANSLGNNKAIVIDTTAPTVASVNSSAANGTYKVGNTVSLQVNFSEAVTVTGTPQLTLETGTTDRAVNYTSGSGTSALTFTYTVQAGDTTADLDYLGITALALNGGTIKDAAGNASTLTLAAPGAANSLGNNKALAIDGVVPVLSSSTPLDNAAGVSTTANLMLTFSENVVAGEGLVLLKNGAGTLIEQFDVTSGEGSLNGSLSITGAAVTIDPHADLAYGTAYYLQVESLAFKDGAGNAFAGISDAEGLNFTTVAAPAPAPAPDPAPPAPSPAPTVVDGTPVQTSTVQNADGSTTTTQSIAPVSSGRPDNAGTPNPQLADIPLATSNGETLLQIGLPTGVGATSQGSEPATSPAALRLQLVTAAGAAGAGGQVDAIDNYLATVPNAGQVVVRTITLATTPGIAPGQPIAITGADGTGEGSTTHPDRQEALVIDARGLPPGSVIQLDKVEFALIIGAVRVIGGAGQNIASGDGSAQWIVLGPDDDIIHGGGGNDVVGSEGGDDQVFGDAGDDIVFGGAGNDLLSGGTGSDKLNGGTGFDVAIQEGARTDYTVVLEGAGIKLTHTASGVSDWLVDVEQVRFATGPSLTVAHSAAEEAGAYLFQKWIGRDLNQGEGAIIQSLTGKTALEVATLFAQVFPEQSAGKTPAQLLEGMGAAGAVRVDAVRDITVTGDAGNNTISPTLGLARYVDGGAGIDTVVIPATLGQTYVQSQNNGSFTLQRLTDGAMLDVTRVERVTFNDTKLALDLNGHAGEAAKLLGALGGPALLANKGVVGEVIRLLDAGASSQTIAGLGLQLLGASTPTQIAQTLWTNVVGRAGTDGELKLLTDIMAGGVSAPDLVVMAGNLEATAVRIDLVGLTAKGIEFA